MAQDDPQAEAPPSAGHTSFAGSDAAASWRRGAASREVWLGPATERMLDLAGVTAGSRVIAVAAGTGEEAISAARRVGSGGSLLATDISASMLEVAATVAGELGLTNVSTHAADVHDLGLADASFDAAICRLGLHFFSDRVRGLGEIRRVLKPGGKLAAIVWGSPEENPYLSIQSSLVQQERNAAGLPVRPPSSFALSDPDVLASALREAGFESVAVHGVEHRRRFESAAAAAANVFDEFPAQRAIAADLPEERRQAVLREIEAGYGRYATADGVDLPGKVLVVVGTR